MSGAEKDEDGSPFWPFPQEDAGNSAEGPERPSRPKKRLRPAPARGPRAEGGAFARLRRTMVESGSAGMPRALSGHSSDLALALLAIAIMVLVVFALT